MIQGKGNKNRNGNWKIPELWCLKVGCLAVLVKWSFTGPPTHQIRSVAQSCPTLCDPVDLSMPGFPVHHQLPKPAQTNVHWISDDTISCSVTLFSSCLQSFPSSRSSQMNQFFTSGGQSIGASALASVLPMNIQGWFPLGLTSLISLIIHPLIHP